MMKNAPPITAPPRMRKPRLTSPLYTCPMPVKRRPQSAARPGLFSVLPLSLTPHPGQISAFGLMSLFPHSGQKFDNSTT